MLRPLGLQQSMDADIVSWLIALGVVSVGLLFARPVRLWLFQWKFIRRSNRGEVREDLRALWREDFDAARAMLNEKTDAPSVFRRTCVELAAGDYTAAHEWAGKLPDHDAACNVLRGLVSKREASADASWLEALEEAWNEAGAPDLRGNKYLNQDMAASFEFDVATDQLNDDERAIYEIITFRRNLWRRREPAKLRTWAEQGANAGRGVAELILGIIVLQNHVFVSGAPGPSERAQLDALAERVDDELWLGLSKFLTTAGGPGFDPVDLGRLERIANAPRVDISLNDAVFRRLLELAEKTDTACANFVAYHGAVVNILLPRLDLFWKLLQQTTDAELQHHAAVLLERIARRMLEDRFLITQVVATATLREANHILRSPELTDEVTKLIATNKGVTNAEDRLHLDPFDWPLRPVQVEIIDKWWANEIEANQHYMSLRRAKLPTARTV